MTIEAIVAVYSDWGIGKAGGQPIVIPEDRRYFRRITGNSAIIVGRRTLLDFPGGKPLPGRKNYILSRVIKHVEGAVVVSGVEELLGAISAEERVFVVGGGSVYDTMLPYVSRVYVTKISAAPESDTFFLNLDKAEGWRLADEGEEKFHEGIGYRFCVYDKA